MRSAVEAWDFRGPLVISPLMPTTCSLTPSKRTIVSNHHFAMHQRTIKRLCIYMEIPGVMVYQQPRIIEAIHMQPKPDSPTFQPDTMPPLFQLRWKEKSDEHACVEVEAWPGYHPNAVNMLPADAMKKFRERLECDQAQSMVTSFMGNEKCKLSRNSIHISSRNC